MLREKIELYSILKIRKNKEEGKINFKRTKAMKSYKQHINPTISIIALNVNS